MRSRVVAWSACVVTMAAAGFGIAHPSARAAALGTKPGSVGSRCDAGAPGVSPSSAFESLLAAALPGGIEVVGSSHEERSKLVVVLHGVTAGCRPVSSFGKNGTAVITLASASPLGEIDTMIATANGELLLAGTDGNNELVGRVLPDGHLDSTFGSSGWTRVRPFEQALDRPPPAPIATSIAEAGSGTIFLGGNDGDAHCCVRDFVTALTSDGALERAFGGSGSIVLPKQFDGSYAATVFPQSGGAVMVMALVVFNGGCGGPVVVRLNANGSLDTRFDATVARSIATVSPAPFLFQPDLVPRKRGGFLLLGDIARSCVVPPAQPLDRGLTLGLLPSGQIDRSFGAGGHAFFPSEDRAGSGLTWTAQVGANSILLLTLPFAARTFLPQGLKVREFSNSGSIDRSFGHAGTSTIDLSGLFKPDLLLNVAAIAAPDDGEVIAFGTQKQIELVRLQL